MSVGLSPVFNGWQGFTIAGVVMAGGLLTTYAAGTSTPVATFTDSTGLVSNANPIQLDAAGLPPNEIWLTRGASVKFVLTDALGLNARTFDNIPAVGNVAFTDLSSTSSASQGSGLIGYNPSLNYVTGTIGYGLATLPNLNSFTGVDPTGTLDCTSQIQAAINFCGVTAGANSTYRTSSALVPPAGRIIQGCGPTSLFQCQSGDVSVFDCTGKNDVVIRDLAIQAVNAGTTAYIAGVLLYGASRCTVERVKMTGLSYWGVGMRGNASHNRVRSCYMSAWQSTSNPLNQDSADVAILGVDGLAAPSYNLIEDNVLLGGGNHGISIQDPYTTTGVLPFGNRVIHNEIGLHTVYGVLVYMPNNNALFTASQTGTVLTVTAITGGTIAVGQDVSTTTGVQLTRIVSLGTGTGGTGTYNMAGSAAIGSQTMSSNPQTNSQNLIFDNDIHDIQGSWAGNRASGMGVYVVGSGSCGTMVLDNRINNCCVQTNLTSLAPAAITVNGTPFGALPVYVKGNEITGMTQYDGLRSAAATGFGNVVYESNAVTMPAANTTGYCAQVNSSNIALLNNKFNMLNPGGSLASIILYATGGVSMSGCTVSGNECYGSTYGIQITQASAGSHSGLSIENNKLGGCLNGIVSDSGILDARILGNKVYATSGAALSLTASLRCRVSDNTLQSTGSTSVILAGTCTGSYFDMSNEWNGLVNDTSTGFFKEVLVAAIPTTGTWATPARAHNSVGTVGVAKGWRLTAAGTPGTWTSEGNL